MRKIVLFLVFITSWLGNAQNYHDTQGKLEISNSGQASYTLPIALPPSISSVGPTLNLVYASGQNGGIAGQGWNIQGISYIARMATRFDIDGYRDGVDFDDNDKLAFDGQRLLIKTGTYWADGSTYETEVQSNTRIELVGSGTSMYFVVTAPDGSRSWYGNYGGMNATDLSAWYIVRYEDTNGNFMVYNYTSDSTNNTIYINNIQFSANTVSNLTTLNKVQFNYETTQRIEKGYLKGQTILKNKILKNIIVTTNNATFKQYIISHVNDEQGYQRVSGIQEFNGANEGANPVVFESDVTPNTITVQTYPYNETYVMTSSPELVGDFDGDGRMDFIKDERLYTKLFQGTANPSIGFPFGIVKNLTFPASTLSNDKLNVSQSIVKTESSINNTTFKVYNYDNNLVTLSYSKTISIDNSMPCVDNCDVEETDENGNPIPNPNDNCSNNTRVNTHREYLEGDFNGDSISEVLIIGKDASVAYNYYPPGNDELGRPIEGGCFPDTTVSNNITIAKIVDLNPNASIADNTSGNSNISNFSLLEGKKRYALDLNGDGKADILNIEANGVYRVLTVNQLTVSPWVNLELLGSGIIENYSEDRLLLFGDYNGDGKTDIMMPATDGNCFPHPNNTVACPNYNLWHIFFSNPKPSGGTFFDKYSYTITPYYHIEDTELPINNYSYYAMDINKDGKSDLVYARTSLWQPNEFLDPKDIDSSWQIFSFVNNLSLNNSFTAYGNTDDYSSDDNSVPIPIASNYKYRGIDSDLIVIRYHGNESFPKLISYVDFNKDFNKDNRITRIFQSGGAIADTLTYTEMMSPTNTGSQFYSSYNISNYPIVEIKNAKENYVVTQIQNTTLGITKKQDFKYQGFNVNVGGVGVLGFRKTARSSWYRHNTIDKKLWSVTENNPLQRGATTKTYTLLLDGNQAFNFDTNYTNLISKTENTYAESPPGVYPYWILLQQQTSTDYLTNIVKKTEYLEYTSPHFLPRQVQYSNFLGTTLHGSKLEVTEFGNNPDGLGANYFIGRPSEKNTTTTVYVNTLNGQPDTKTAYQKLTYDTRGNVTLIEKKANNDAVTLVEQMDYYPNGLLWKKRLTQTGFTPQSWDTSNGVRETIYTYDTTNRFVKTITDPESVVTTNNSYHPLYGLITSATNNTLALTSTSIYDNWGKRTQGTDPYGVKTNYAYSRTNNIYTTTTTVTNSNNVSDGSMSIIEQNVLAQEIRKGTKDINGNWIYRTMEYDYLGRKARESEPYFGTNTPTQWNTITYDDYSRPIANTAYTGRTVTTEYNGTTVTATDDAAGLVKSKTTNANGVVIAATDTPGGTIQFSYDAAGNLLQSSYDGILTKITYDNWGRKRTLDDPSSDMLYEYNYNAYGENIYEKTPKGETRLVLSPIGKLNQKIETGDNTNITTTYAYNATTKLPSQTSILNTNNSSTASTYQYLYDGSKRLYKTVETLQLPGTVTAIFTKQLTFDTYNRINTETSIANAHGKTTTKTITSIYQNGYKKQLKDGTTVVWQVNSNDARGNVLTGTLGNGIAVTNAYDEYGYTSQYKHDLNGANVMTLNTAFEPVLGNLTNKYNSLFNLTENFTYDELDRLVYWDNTGITYFNLNFDNSTENFVPVDIATITQEQSKLKVIATDAGSGTQRLLHNGLETGKKIKVTGSYTRISGTIPVLVLIDETDSDGNIHTEQKYNFVSSGNFEFDYISQYGGSITLRFANDVMPSSLTQPPTGTTATATYYIDTVVVLLYEQNTQNYDDRGRITQNVMGNYSYYSNKPYRNRRITPPIASNPSMGLHLADSQNIVYNAFKLPVSITLKNNSGVATEIAEYNYNGEHERCAMYWGSAATDKLARPNRRYYSADGSMEVNLTFTAGNTSIPATVELFTYIGGNAYSAVAVNKAVFTGSSTTPTGGLYYLHRDYQGSIIAITSSTGAVVEKRLFDPWGALKKVQNGAGAILPTMQFFERGYTGHEHLQSVGLIHMNARLYDAKTHRFLSPDTYIQDPYNTQNYNRYGYCVNNPTKYTDITGNVFGVDDAIIIGMAVGLSSYLIGNLVSGQPITIMGSIQATILGGVSGAVTFGIGEAFKGMAFIAKAGYSALSHGAFQGLMSGIQGGGFWAGAASGALSSIAGSAMERVGNMKALNSKGELSTYGAVHPDRMVAFTLGSGAIMGGAGAALAGGNFWQGAVTGLVVSGLNHVAHNIVGRIKFRQNLINRLKSAGYNDPEASASFGNLNLIEFAKSVFPDLFSMAQNPKIEPIEDVNAFEKGYTHRPYNKTTGENYIEKIEICRSAFKNYIHLSSTIGHELIHAIHSYDGCWQSWYLAKGFDYAHNMSENEAYTWQLSERPEIYKYDYNVYNPFAHKIFIDALK